MNIPLLLFIAEPKIPLQHY